MHRKREKPWTFAFNDLTASKRAAGKGRNCAFKYKKNGFLERLSKRFPALSPGRSTLTFEERVTQIYVSAWRPSGNSRRRFKFLHNIRLPYTKRDRAIPSIKFLDGAGRNVISLLFVYGSSVYRLPSAPRNRIIIQMSLVSYAYFVKILKTPCHRVSSLAGWPNCHAFPG